MKIRAVVFDIYGTLLEVGPPPADADVRWESLWRELLATPARLSLAEFAAATETIIAREHTAARRSGIPFPEIFWPAVAAEVVPEVARLPAAMSDNFLFRHAGLRRTCRLIPGAAETLAFLRSSGVLLGIASNAQPYTLRELKAALGAAGLSPAIFPAAIRFHSFEHGFSKPDPHVFRILTARLRSLGIEPRETLMVGDRCDNDIAPARAQGWQTWRLEAGASGRSSGDWAKLRAWLEGGG